MAPSSTLSPPSPSAQLPQGTDLSSRTLLLNLGRSGRSWEFLAAAASQRDPDPEIRYLLAANLARVGLPTLALEQIELLPPPHRRHDAVRSLHTAARALPPDLVAEDRLATVVGANLRALRSRGVGVAGPPDRWRERAANSQHFTAADGTLVSRPVDAPLAQCRGLGPDRELARRIIAETNLASADLAPGIIVEGLSPPWLAIEAFRASSPRALGFRPPVVLIEPDTDALIEALPFVELAELAADNVHWFVGPGATDRLREWLLDRLDCKLAWLSVQTPAPRTPASPPVLRVIADAGAAQRAEESRRADAVRARSANRDAAFWAARFARAQSGGPPLRVLIPTCRYSTFIKHSAADIAAALERLGCRTNVLVERDDSSQMSSVAYLRELDTFDPDLVLLINYTRANMAGVVPPNIPYVCWIQDPMPHLFDEQVGRAQGPLDFLVGHLHQALFDKHAYPTDRALPTPVLVDAGTFRDAPGDADLERRFACEVAMVSHHSETPEAMHARLCAEASDSPVMIRAMELLAPRVRDVAAHIDTLSATQSLRAAVDASIADAGLDPAAADVLLRHYATPLADRILRHETLRWAADICAARSWRLHIYGRGWERHPTLAPFARGELPHAEELRVAYRSARVHLHAALSSAMHQRVFEAALSGGLCFIRWHPELLAVTRGRLQARLAQLQHVARDPARRFLGHWTADHADAMALAALEHRLGYPPAEPYSWVPEIRLPAFRARARLLDAEIDPAEILGDPAIVAFRTRDALEARLARAINDPAWRDGTARMVTTRVRERLTYDAFLARLLEFLRERLGANPSPAGAA